ncbi:MAG: Do family serine endopeptidase [Ignavibacteriota bacterium]|nr:MAG: Do family serine endopeptidase [Chlorobiota bacterium]MBE7478165.1 Do family serine endopeptidase [Ignavibacteriales bacterium]MBL1121605.1 Do family serine endopeptidase [Ignavibacteriota bacterium]MCC7093046.1 Do family serine endopeptidase [Ignavibacteriaceae bacterium]MCE7856745.1 Do family serine endopeptidase [Ignavibacteria bacterium CHB3]MEB2297089.1 Do family serine endopeptidase [Ignavibacteria bacterium]
MKTKGIVGALTLLFIGILFGAILVSGFGLVRPGLADINLGANEPPVKLDADASSFSQAFIEVAAKVTPAIVQITVVSERENPHSDWFFFPFKDMPKEQRGSGSGIIISQDGYIVTNNHVVENASKVTVGLSDKRQFDATIVGTDPLTDLAVVKIDASNLPVAFLGNSENLKVGQWVMAIGNPLSLSSTVTAGIVSAIGRGQLGLIRDSYGVENFIQTDAAINPGNSGGALVDLSGAVIGINSAIASGGGGTYIGYGFAIPINLAKAVSQDLIAHGKVSRGYIGINIGEVDDALAKSLGMDKPKGIIIQGIVEDGAASKSDLRAGDIILDIDGREVNKPNELQSYVAALTAGTTVKLKIYRNGETLERKVTLKARDEDSKTEPISNKDDSMEKDNSGSGTATFDNIGLTVKNLTNNDKTEFKLDNGILITNVKPFSKAEDQRLFAGLIITEANKEKVNNVNDFRRIVDEKKGSALLIKVVDKDGNNRFVGIEIPE